jgi:type II secretory pathway pseudopilin PulG
MRRRTNGTRGFTLIELTIALAAGLLVGLAVVGLAKEATSTFHEETRAATAEMSLRAAIDRLRADLMRASYMSTPNIWGDPQLVTNYSPGAQVTGIQRLAGIRLFNGGSVAKAALGSPTPTMNGTDEIGMTLSANNGVAPDAMDITGNLNSTDVYFVGTVNPGTGGCGGDQLVFDNISPAVYRLRSIPGATGPLDELKRQFIPVAGKRFLVRVQDAQGRHQYAEACSVAFTTDTPPRPAVNLVTTLVQAQGTGNVGGISGLAGMIVNPVLTVRWKIAPTVAPYVADLSGDGGTDAEKFDLYRVYIDSTNHEVGTPELVAEYAIDLKFAFTVDDTASSGVACPAPITTCPPYTPTRTQSSLPFADPLNASSWAPDTSAGTVRNPGPQRIRSVRVRVATRTALADRNLLLAPPTYTPAGYLYRYCTQNVAVATCKAFARVRTLMTEVALNNQAKALYP